VQTLHRPSARPQWLGRQQPLSCGAFAKVGAKQFHLCIIAASTIPVAGAERGELGAESTILARINEDLFGKTGRASHHCLSLLRRGTNMCIIGPMKQTIKTSFVPILYFNVHEQSSICGVMQNRIPAPSLRVLVPSSVRASSVFSFHTLYKSRFLLAEFSIKVQRRMKCAY